jgi:hypothetical protein
LAQARKVVASEVGKDNAELSKIVRPPKIVFINSLLSLLLHQLLTLLNHPFLQSFSAMPPKALSSPPAVAPRSFATKATIYAIVFALLTSLYLFLDAHLDWFYILNPTDLYDLSLRAIGAHGNDTAAVVAYITGELSEKLPGGYINLNEEWIFNNAGGAMGAMYIIHASKLLLWPLVPGVFEAPNAISHP